MVTLDLSQTSDNEDFELIPEGTKAEAAIFDVQVRESDKSGDKYLCLDWKIQDGEYEERQIKFDQPYMLEGKGAFRSEELLNAVAPELLDNLEDETTEFDPEDLFGRKAEIVISVEEYNGDENNGVMAVNPPNNGSAGDDFLPEPEDEEVFEPDPV